MRLLKYKLQAKTAAKTMVKKANKKKTSTCLHNLNNRHNLIHMFAGGHKALQHEDLEVLKHVTALSSHYLQQEIQL